MSDSNTPFYSVLIKNSVTIPGDERSRTNPGHGYPESTHEYLEAIKFDDLDELRKWIVKHDSKRASQVVKCSPVFVMVENVVHLDGV